MGLQFTPKTEEQLALDRCLPDGEYDFEVLIARDTVTGPNSKNPGTPMIELKLGIYGPDGGMRTVIDRIMETFGHKLRHFCDATGLLPQYQSGSLAADVCQGRSGRCKVVVKIDKDGKYPPKNDVVDYCLRKIKPIAPPAAAQSKTVQPPEDDVPF